MHTQWVHTAVVMTCFLRNSTHTASTVPSVNADARSLADAVGSLHSGRNRAGLGNRTIAMYNSVPSSNSAGAAAAARPCESSEPYAGCRARDGSS